MMNDTAFTAGELLDRMSTAFRTAGIEAPEMEAIAMLAELRDCNRMRARTERNVPLSEAVFSAGLDAMEKRLRNMPWQYIFHRAYFRDLTLYVDENVLIPRPETELLVDWCVECLPERGTLLDVGTGSGAIALSVATERPDAAVIACDVSPGALAVARRNGEKCAPGRVEFAASDLFSAFPGRKFDLIAANLPYITDGEYESLDANVRDFEPRLALTSGADGLDLIRIAVREAGAHLSRHGAVILELAPPQALPVAELFAAMQCYTAIEIRKDLTGRDRFVCARLRNEI